MLNLFLNKINTPYYGISLTFYFVLLFVILIFSLLFESYSKSKYSFVWLFGIGIIFWFVYGFRYAVGSDYFSYISIYNSIKSYDDFFLCIKNIEIVKEPIYVLLNYILTRFFDDGFIIYLIIGIFNTFLIISGLYYFRNNISVTTGFAIYYLSLFPYTTNAVRSCICCCIMFYALRYIYENKFWKYCFFIFLATLLHKTALLGLFFILLKAFKSETSNKLRNIIYYIIILLTPITVKFALDSVKYIPILDFYYNKYYYRFQSEASGSGLGVLWLMPIILLVLFNRKKLIHNNIHNEVLINILLLKIPLTFSGYYMLWAYRLRLFAEISELLVVPMVIKLQSNKFNKITITIFVLVYYMTYFVYKFFIHGINDMFPYQTILNYLC